MTTTEDPTDTATTPQVEVEERRAASRGWFPQMLLRLHFYAGILVGPFIVLAALGGIGYAAAPWLEAVVYHSQLTTESRGHYRPLAEQIAAAQGFLAHQHPDDQLVGVKPASAVSATTQVMFSETGLMDGQVRSVWVDPVTAQTRGDLLVYSTALPIQTWFDTFHRNLFLGDLGSLYSEVAASWLGIITLAGLVLWVLRVRRARHRRDFIRPNNRAHGYRRMLSWHTATGVWLLLGALFLSATGITWSIYAGGNVGIIQSALDWRTPALDAEDHAADSAAGGTAQRAGQDLEIFDQVLAKARSVNIHAAEVEIDLPADRGQAWTVAEIRRTFPTAVSSVGVAPADMRVVGRTDFADYPLVAKLIRWGIDTHMGLMWGAANRVLLIVTALGLTAMVCFAYLLWWQRRSTRSGPGRRFGRPPAAGGFARAPRWGTALVLLAAIGIGWLLPTVGVPLIAFVLIDTLVHVLRRPHEATPAVPHSPRT